MKVTATIDNIAFAASIIAMVAIATESTIAIVSAERQFAINEKGGGDCE